MLNLILASSIIFIVNIPFGYWRAAVPKKSKQWFIAIHAPVPVVVFMRYFADLGFELYTYFFTVGAFFAGQLAGAFIYRFFKKRMNGNHSSCMVMDICRFSKVCK